MGLLSFSKLFLIIAWFRAQGSGCGGGFAAKKEANPASLRSAAPSLGRGSRGRSLLPMEGGAPKGRRLDGDGGVKKSEEERLKYAVCESTLSTADAVPLPQWGRLRYENTAIPEIKPFPRGEGKEEAASPPKKGSQLRLAALGSPFQGKGLAWTLPPSYGRRCLEGADKDKMFCRSL